MRALNRTGTTLIELMVGLTLVGSLSAACVALVTGVSRAARRAATKLAEEQTVATLGRLLRHELDQASSSDVTLLSANTLLFRRTVGSAAICQSDVRMLTVAEAEWQGTRLPDPTRDRLSLLPFANPSTWVEAIPLAISAAHCPDGRAAWRLTVDRDISPVWYLRVGEPVRLSVYRSNGWDWYGLAPGDGSSSVQPFAGPLHPGSGQPQLSVDQLVMPGQHPLGALFTVTIPLAPSGEITP